MANVLCPQCGSPTETRCNRKNAIHGVCTTPQLHKTYKGLAPEQMILPEIPPPPPKVKPKEGFLDKWF